MRSLHFPPFSPVYRSASLLIIAASAAALLGSCSTTPQASAQAPVDCAQMAARFVAPNTRIEPAESIPAGLVVPGMASPYPMPAHCKINGKMFERTGVDGKPYAIGFEMRLPANWNQRFLFQANGGSIVGPMKRNRTQ